MELNMTLDRIISDSNILDGQPYFRGTRIPVAAVLQLLAKRKSFEDIIERSFPSLTVKDIEACLNFAVLSLSNFVTKKTSFDDFTDSYTRTMERRIRALETERQLLEVQRNKLEVERDNLKRELQRLRQ